MSPEVQSALLGVLGGTAATFLWELAISPGRQRRRVARLVLAEMLVNRHLIQIEREQFAKDPTKPVPQSFRLYTSVFETLGPARAELSPPTLVAVVWTYRHYDKLMSLAPRFWRNLEGRSPRSRPGTNVKVAESTKTSFRVHLEHVEIVMARTLPLLEYQALPWWSPRRRVLRLESKPHAEEWIKMFAASVDLESV